MPRTAAIAWSLAVILLPARSRAQEDESAFLDRVQRVLDLQKAGRHEEALPLAEALRAEVLESPRPDPVRLGWAHFARFRSLYGLQRYQEAWDAARSPGGYAIVGPQNAAWMSSVCVELASRLGKPDEILEHGRRCLQLRIAIGAEIDVQYACQTICRYLRESGRSGQNGIFAARLARIAAEGRNRALATEAFGYLLDNHDVSGDPAVAAEIALRIDPFRDDPRFDPALMERASRIAAERETQRSALDHARARDLWSAAAAGDLERVRSLVGDDGADPNLVDLSRPELPTSLFAAVEGGHLEVVKLLLSSGADRRILALGGQTAAELARSRNRADLVEALEGR